MNSSWRVVVVGAAALAVGALLFVRRRAPTQLLQRR